jgi:3-deoxy-manno-octulosonate cytidylyltransferase (CMP-KDO synthetase)
MNPIILIPARMASTRLPNKPLALIAGKPMIVRVAERVAQAGFKEIYVACDGLLIEAAVTAAGYEAVLTDPALLSGSDRIYAALSRIDPQKKFDVVVNVQGDMPTLDPAIIGKATALLENPETDIATLAAVITDEAEKTETSVVKAVINGQGQALNFTRKLQPSQDGRFLHHIGIYAYKRPALEKFVSLPPSPLELSEKLEQLRALNAGMRIDVAVVDTVPLGVDTPETLEKARQWYGK